MFRLAGPVDPSVRVGGQRTLGAVAWAWIVDGRVDGTVEEAGFEPLVYQYAMEVPPPPDPSQEGQGSEPSPWGPVGAALLVGLPILVEPSRGAEAELRVDAVALQAWAAGEDVPPSSLVEVRGGRFAAYTPEHLLLLVGEGEGPGSEGWTPGGALCAWDAALPGLTLYRSVGEGCSAWEPLAPPGTRTGFQGIGIAAP